MRFPKVDLKRIDEADDLHISPFREDGKTYGTPTWIWSVVLGGELYVRAYFGIDSRWYKSALIQKAGRIHAAGMIRDAAFELVQTEIQDSIDEAYRKQYRSSPYLLPMISHRSYAATMKIIPK
jgi:hypothetical protein